jgi:hypothetical protein
VIYYIACTATERMKIGYTRGEPEVRLKQLQTGSASTLRLIACHQGSPESERRLHEQFASDRIRGEWFNTSDALREHISLVIWFSAAEFAVSGEAPPLWIKAGLRAMADGALMPLPQLMADLIA